MRDGSKEGEGVEGRRRIGGWERGREGGREGGRERLKQYQLGWEKLVLFEERSG